MNFNQEIFLSDIHNWSITMFEILFDLHYKPKYKELK
jgi:hypothetical protein